MPHYSYVADLTSLVRFHGVLLLEEMARKFASERSLAPGSQKRDLGHPRERMGRGNLVAGIVRARQWWRSSGRVAGVGVRFSRLPHPYGWSKRDVAAEVKDSRAPWSKNGCYHSRSMNVV